MKIVKGARVGAMAEADDTMVRLFGYGTYEGDEVPPPGIIGPYGLDMHSPGLSNPKLVMDNGSVVWGCECWWGPEEGVHKIVGTRSVCPITPEQFRAEAKQEAEQELAGSIEVTPEGGSDSE